MCPLYNNINLEFSYTSYCQPPQANEDIDVFRLAYYYAADYILNLYVLHTA